MTDIIIMNSDGVEKGNLDDYELNSSKPMLINDEIYMVPEIKLK